MSSSISSIVHQRFRARYRNFLEAVELLASQPETACVRYGDYNTAWELKDDALSGRLLIGSGLFSETQERELGCFLDVLSAVPVHEMPAGAGREVNLAAMRDTAWEPVRTMARRLLASLAPVSAIMLPREDMPLSALAALQGQVVTHVWYAEAAALYLELGELSPGRRNQPVGMFTVYAGHDWCIEAGDSLWLGAEDASVSRRLLGATLTSIRVSRHQAGLEMEFSSGERLWTCAEDDPEWSVSFRAGHLRHLSVVNGEVVAETRNS